MDTDDKDKHTALADDSLAFFGAITASVSHELNNVIAIMDQTAGLLEDKLAGGQDPVSIPAEKLDKIVTSLQHQAQRGLDIIKRLNRFAHSADDSRAAFAVTETLGNLVLLTGRLAGLKGALIESRLSPDTPKLPGNQFVFQQAVFAALLVCLRRARKNDSITVASQPGQQGVDITIEMPTHDDTPATAESDEIRRVMDHVSGRVGVDTTGDMMSIRMTFPG